MSADNSHDDSKTYNGARTEVQKESDIASSAELSIPQHIRQSDSAPEVTGYILAEPLGEGAYGKVWRSWQMRTRKEVAVKVFTQRSGLDWIFLQREVERLTRLDRHPHIVSLLDMGLDDEPPFYVMDLIEQGSLESFVQPQNTAQVDRAFLWFEQICDALSYVHSKGLIHCDLKPANILLDGREHIRVVDFGQSRIFTESSASMGTLFYMDPQQAVLSEPGSPVQPDIRWDIYALGATMYSILTGHVPYTSPKNVEAIQSAPTLNDRLQRYRNMLKNDPLPSWELNSKTFNPELIAIIQKCMSHRMEDRYDNINAITSDLQAIRTHRPVTPLAAGKPYRIRKFVQRNPFRIGMAAALLAMVVASVLFSIRGAKLDLAAAHTIMKTFVHDPVHAMNQSTQATDRIKNNLKQITQRHLSSLAFTDRIMGVRAGLWIAPDAFWKSVDGGPLYTNGEWLELDLAYGDSEEFNQNNKQLSETLLSQWQDKLSNGSTYEKYVALCLLGQFSRDGNDLADKCEQAIQSSTDPGVVSAAWWAARRLGQDISIPANENVYMDDTTGLIFSAIPATKSFQRGSSIDDLDRFEDEYKPDPPVTIDEFWMATTEITISQFADFWIVFRQTARLDPASIKEIEYRNGLVANDDLSIAAATHISLDLANSYVEWLNAKVAGKSPARHYRLPVEDEWEYACRGGNSGRFCYGDSAEYVRYFAHCNGSEASYHTVAQRMPNAFGLFDMHGGQWELTSSPYRADPAADPQSNVQKLFVKRGGSWYSPAVRCRSTQRNYISSHVMDMYTGLRLVMEMER